jgi:hypothetical protein
MKLNQNIKTNANPNQTLTLRNPNTNHDRGSARWKHENMWEQYIQTKWKVCKTVILHVTLILTNLNPNLTLTNLNPN